MKQSQSPCIFSIPNPILIVFGGGTAFQDGLICAAEVYESRQYSMGRALVFREENENLKWEGVVDDRGLEGAIFQQKLLVLKRNGGLVLNPHNGRTILKTDLHVFGFHGVPMSMACNRSSILIGLRNGQLLELEIDPSNVEDLSE